MLNRSAAAALAAVSVLLSLGTTPCAVAGRTNLRGGSAAAPAAAEKRVDHSGRRIRGGGRRLQATAAPTAGKTRPPDPQCTTLFVPTMAGALTGSYTFKGRFNDGHPVYTDSTTGNNIFHDSSNFYITQPFGMLFLSLETDVFEPYDLVGLQPWVRNNDPSRCTGCTWNMLIACTTLTADVVAAGTPAPTTAAAVGANAMETTSNSTTADAVAPTAPPASSFNSTTSLIDATDTTDTTDTSVIGGCMSLNIQNGAARTGVYVLNTNAADDAVLINGRPSYIGVGVNRTADQVFTVMMDVCGAGYGVVDAAWAALVGDLSPTASAQAVFLMYVAEHAAPPDPASTAGCEVPVWFVTSGGGGDLEAAGEYTFLSLSDVEDPSEATSWARFTPATDTSRATLVEISRIDVGCADANEVEEALEGDEEAGAGAGEAAATVVAGGEESGADTPPLPTPVGSEPNGNGRRRLRAN